MGWLDNVRANSRRYRLRRASYKLPLQVPAAKIVIDDPVELKYEAASCCCKDSVLTKVLTKVLLVDVHLTTWIDPRSRWTSPFSRAHRQPRPYYFGVLFIAREGKCGAKRREKFDCWACQHQFLVNNNHSKAR